MLRGIENKLRNKLGAAPAVSGEGPHLPMTNYCGPKTNLEHKDKYGPVSGKYNGLDRVCQQHDYSYADAEGIPDPRKKFQLIQMADAEMVRQIQNLPPEQRGFFAKFAKFIINKKHQIEGQLGTPVYGGLPLGAQPVITVNKPRKRSTGVRASLSETMKPARKTLQELKQYILANMPATTQNTIFFKRFMDDLDKSVHGLEQTMALLPEDQIVKFVNNAIYTKNYTFLGDLQKKKSDLEAKKLKLLSSAKYRSESTQVKKRLVDTINKQIKGLNEQLTKASAGFDLVSKASAPVSKVTESSFSTRPLWADYDEAEQEYKTAKQLLDHVKSLKEKYPKETYHEIVEGLGSEQNEKFRELFGNPAAGGGRRFKMWEAQVGRLGRLMVVAEDKLMDEDGNKYARDVVVKKVDGEGDVDLDEYLDEMISKDSIATSTPATTPAPVKRLYQDPNVPGLSYSSPNENDTSREMYFDPYHSLPDGEDVPDDATVLKDFEEWLRRQPGMLIHKADDEQEDDSQKPIIASGRKYLKAKPLQSKKKAAPRKPRKKTISA